MSPELQILLEEMRTDIREIRTKVDSFAELNLKEIASDVEDLKKWKWQTIGKMSVITVIISGATTALISIFF